MFLREKEDSAMKGDIKERLKNVALEVFLVPAAHQLNLLVEDPTLEKKLRVECELFIKRSFTDDKRNKKASPMKEEIEG